MHHRVGKLFRRSILEKIASRAGANGGNDHNWVKMHAERQNGGVRSV